LSAEHLPVSVSIIYVYNYVLILCQEDPSLHLRRDNARVPDNPTPTPISTRHSESVIYFYNHVQI
jgi:hypothetical protein